MKTCVSLIFTLITVLILTACAPAQAPATPNPQPSPTAIALPSPIATETPKPTATPTSAPTRTYTLKPTLTPTFTPSPVLTSALSAGYRNYTIPHWISINIPEDWYSIRPDRPGNIVLSNVDIDFPYFQLREGTALLMLFEFGDPDQSPLDILNNGYIPTLGEDRKIIETPKSIQVNDLPAATTKYTSPQSEGNAIEKITIIIDQGKSIGFLSIALEKEYDQFEPQFSEMINSLTIYPDTPSPNVQELKQGALDNYLLYEDRGYSFYYPSEWEVDAIDQDLLMIKPPGVESVFGPVYIIPPDSMETWVELSGVKLEGQKVELVPILYEMLWAYGFMVVHDVQVVSSPEQKRNGNQDFLTVIVGATDNDKEIPISGIFSVVKGKDQVLGLFTWMYDLEKNIHRVETIISSIQIE